MRIGGADLDLLRRLAGQLEGREDEIAARWERAYATAFAGDGYHCLTDFAGEAREEIDAILGHLRNADREGLAAWFSERGREQFERGVPFSEVCRSLHLFEESVVDAIRGGERTAEEVLELYGVLDHLSHERLILIVEAYHETCHRRWERTQKALIAEVARRERDAGRRDRLGGMIGRSPEIQEVFERISLAGTSRDAVLLTGGTGTGKDLAARTIHLVSGDPPDRFVPVNCAALSHDLIESELFGHRRGSFSGAREEHPGLFRAAAGGTLFLDEVTELPPGAQAKLLRALQERAVRPVGGLEEIAVDARIVASTNRDLEEALEEGRVRRDLYYRLRQLVIAIPPLRDRREDVPLLVRHFAEKAAGDGLCPAAPELEPEALARLEAHDWPGNVRELENVVRLACRLSGGRRVTVDHVKLEARPSSAAPRPAAAAEPLSMRDAERDAIRRALEATDGNKTRAAQLLGISRKKLYAKIKAYAL